MADCLAIGQLGIEPGLQALLVEYHRHARVDLLGDATGRLGQYRATWLAVGSLRPDPGEPQRLAVAAGQVVGLLAVLYCLPLVPAIGRHQAAVMGEGPAEVGRGSDLLDGGVDGLRGLVVGPVRSVAPPQRLQAKLATVIMPAHCRDPGARRDVVARRQLTLGRRQLEVTCQAGEVTVEGKAAAHSSKTISL